MVTRVSAKAQFEYIADSLNTGIKNELERRGVQTTKVLRNAELEVLSGTRSGRKYTRLPNRSSVAGEPPAAQFGTLRREWNEDTLTEGNRVVSRLTSNTEYAGWLEDGTSKMKPRPYVNRIIDKAMQEIERIHGEPYSKFISIWTRR